MTSCKQSPARPASLGRWPGGRLFTTLRASVLCSALQTFRALRSMFATLHAGIGIKQTHIYARRAYYSHHLICIVPFTRRGPSHPRALPRFICIATHLFVREDSRIRVTPLTACSALRAIPSLRSALTAFGGYVLITSRFVCDSWSFHHDSSAKLVLAYLTLGAPLRSHYVRNRLANCEHKGGSKVALTIPKP